MKSIRKSKNKRYTYPVNTNNPTANSRNVTRLQEKQVKRGRFTKYS